MANRPSLVPSAFIAAGFRAGVRPAVVVGGLALAGAAVSSLLFAPNLVAVGLAGVAAAGLAATPRLGPLGAALLVALVLPWGRGADTFTVEIGGAPIRPHDLALVVGMVGALPFVRRPVRWRATALLLAAFLALGLAGFAVGLLLDHPIRDVLRDARWWLFFGAGLLALLGGMTRPQLLRAILIGTAVFSGLVVVAALLPALPGGLKHQELLYDRGTLRMQFGNSAFLLPAIAWVSFRVLRRAEVRTVVWLGLLLTAVVLSLTRTSILVTGGMLVLAVVAGVTSGLGRGSARRPAGAVAVVLATAGAALVVGLAINVAGTPPAASVPTSGGQVGQQPIDRILFQDDRSDIGSLEVGRFPSYRIAARHILDRPVTGGGLGMLTEVDYAYNTVRTSTIGMLPGVDNAYLTVGLKTGIPGIVVFAMLMLSPLTTLLAIRHGRVRARLAWFAVAWAGLLVLSMTQSYATSLYGPFAVAQLLVLPLLSGRLPAPAARWPAPRPSRAGA